MLMCRYSAFCKLIMIAIFFIVNQTVAVCQTVSPFTRVCLNIHQQSLESVLDSLSAKTGYLFSYDPTIVHTARLVTVRFDKKALNDCLSELFEYDSLNFQFVNKHVIISKKVTLQPAVIQCKGRVVDAYTNQPLEFATISFRGKTIGTVTNTRGEFVLNIPRELLSERLWVSYVGYVPENYSITSDTVMTVKLKSAPNMLKEVIIDFVDPKELIHAVYDDLDKNYLMSPVAMTGFYREISTKNSDYVSITEAVVAIDKAAYFSSRRDKIYVLKARKSTDVVKMDTIAYKFQGGLTTCLVLDVIKNKPSFADREFESFYDYKLDKVQTIENENVYAISFEQKPNTEYPFYCGKIYINAKSKALVEVEFALSPSGLKYALQELIVKSPLRYKVKPLQASYRVSYRLYNGKWYLSHVRSETLVNVRRKNRLFSNMYRTVAEMVITQFDTVPSKEPVEGVLFKSNEIISDKSLPYDAKFWGDQNVIKPEEPIENALKKLTNQLAAWQKAKEEFELKTEGK